MNETRAEDTAAAGGPAPNSRPAERAHGETATARRSDLMSMLDKLGDLYVITGYDWDFQLHHCLTEPTCPTATIGPEGWQISRYRVDCSGIEESTRLAVELVYREIVERTVIGSYAPFSNPDDDAFAKWLYARAAGSDDKMPDVPGRGLPDSYRWVAEGFIRERADQLAQLSANSGGYLLGYVMARITRYFPDARIDHERARDVVRAVLDACESSTESRNARTIRVEGAEAPPSAPLQTNPLSSPGNETEEQHKGRT